VNPKLHRASRRHHITGDPCRRGLPARSTAAKTIRRPAAGQKGHRTHGRGAHLLSLRAECLFHDGAPSPGKPKQGCFLPALAAGDSPRVRASDNSSGGEEDLSPTFSPPQPWGWGKARPPLCRGSHQASACTRRRASGQPRPPALPRRRPAPPMLAHLPTPSEASPLPQRRCPQAQCVLPHRGRPHR
jgi:hypothetical protein